MGKSNAGTSKHRKKFNKRGGSKGPIIPKWNEPVYNNKYTSRPKPAPPQPRQYPSAPRRYNRMGYFLGMLKLSEIELELTGRQVDSELEEKIKETMTNPSLKENHFTVAFEKNVNGQRIINLSTYLQKQVINSIIKDYDGVMALNVRFIGYTKLQILLENKDYAENEEIINKEALKSLLN